MQRITWLFLVILCSAILLNAEDKGNTMSGWVCDSKCVVQSADRATCNLNCTERSEDAVFINDQGKVLQISNPASCSSHMNKRVKATAIYKDQGKTKQDRQQMIRIQELRDDTPRSNAAVEGSRADLRLPFCRAR
jgi:DNA replicative helicase MCM subunit Mcm2 (Cdc46/Mcm family)